MMIAMMTTMTMTTTVVMPSLHRAVVRVFDAACDRSIDMEHEAAVETSCRSVCL